jgi:hypothetical protein
MKKNKGVIAILVGIGLLFISIFFSSGSSSRYTFIGNISRMKIVLHRGTGRYHEGRVAVPLKYPLSLSVVLILLGTGIVLISKDKEKGA